MTKPGCGAAVNPAISHHIDSHGRKVIKWEKPLPGEPEHFTGWVKEELSR